MEAQMKRGFLEACVLAAVSGEESYGYCKNSDLTRMDCALSLIHI